MTPILPVTDPAIHGLFNAPGLGPRPMKHILPLIVAAVMLPFTPLAAQRSDQDAAYRALREGQAMSLKDIERRILPQMGGATYLGPEYDRGSGIYRLKFMRSGTVIWVDVDGRSGRIIGQSGR